MIGVDAFDQPLRGLLLAFAGVTLVLLALRERAPALAWPGIAEATLAGARERDGARLAALGLRALALVALAAACAGPVALRPVPPEIGRGLDLVLVLDASGSMRALDVDAEGDARTRIDLAREVVSRFARERAAAGDRIALVVFGDVAFTQAPLTSDGRLLDAALRRVEAGVAGESTALGDALALGVKRALGGGSPLLDASPAPAPVAGRVVVLLTDGRSNTGALPVDVATALARAAGVRVHAIGFGGTGPVPVASESRGTRAVRFERHDLDEPALRRIALATGGRFFPARRSPDLASAYAEIDALERVLRPASPKPRRAARPEPFLLAAGLLLALELALARVWRRTIP